uniref:Uncharacterized protein n=1 Tax=Parascaris univalens TaxID=6257 RepID=A0A914ZD78_PARUN
MNIIAPRKMVLLSEEHNNLQCMVGCSLATKSTEKSTPRVYRDLMKRHRRSDEKNSLVVTFRVSHRSYMCCSGIVHIDKTAFKRRNR